MTFNFNCQFCWSHFYTDLLLGSMKFGPSPLLSKTDNLPLPCYIKKKDDKIIDPRRVDFSRRRVKTAHTHDLSHFQRRRLLSNICHCFYLQQQQFLEHARSIPAGTSKEPALARKKGLPVYQSSLLFISLFIWKIMQPSIMLWKSGQLISYGRVCMLIFRRMKKVFSQRAGWLVLGNLLFGKSGE